MSQTPEKPKRGRPSAFSPELGNGIEGKYRFPAAIWALLKQPEIKRLLNRVAMDEKFKVKVFKLVPPKSSET